MDRKGVRVKVLCPSFGWAFAAIMVLGVPAALAAPQNPLADPTAAQEQPPAEHAAAAPGKQATPAAQYTLHAYANLVQIPVLVLSSTRDRLVKPVPTNHFGLSIDSGPWFRPTHVRPEGDDPIALSILLDTHGDAVDLLPRIPQQLAALAPEFLHPADRVSIYSLDCVLVRSANYLPVSSSLLQRSVDAALQSWKERRASHSRCPESAHLQQALAYLTRQMEDLPGRRVILVLSAGEEEIAKPSWREVAEAAQNSGTAIFAIAPLAVQFQQVRGVHPLGGDTGNLLNMVCELTGGTLVTSSSGELPGTLRNFTRMLRERYIVDFPRPSNSTPGRHSFDVRIDKTAAFIRPAGISVPIADPGVLADPTTVPSDPNLTPVQGNRAILPH